MNSLDEKGQLDIKTAAAKYKSLWKEDLTKLEMDLRGEMTKIETNLKDEMNKLGMNLRGGLKGAKTELILWMFGVFLTVVLTILGLYFKD